MLGYMKPSLCGFRRGNLMNSIRTYSEIQPDSRCEAARASHFADASGIRSRLRLFDVIRRQKVSRTGKPPQGAKGGLRRSAFGGAFATPPRCPLLPRLNREILRYEACFGEHSNGISDSAKKARITSKAKACSGLIRKPE